MHINKFGSFGSRHIYITDVRPDFDRPTWKQIFEMIWKKIFHFLGR